MTFWTIAKHQDEKVEPIIRIEAFLSKVADNVSMIVVKLIFLLNAGYWFDKIEDGLEECVDVKLYWVTVNVDNSKLQQLYELLMLIIFE